MDLTQPLAPLPQKAPLLNPKWVRGIFSSRLSQSVPSSELDVEAYVRHKVTGRPLLRVPWRPVLTMSAGVRCFVDTGAPLDILADDFRDVIRNLRAIAGFDRVTVTAFETFPDDPSPFSDPVEDAAIGAPVLLLTDFGHYRLPGRRRAFVADWLAYLDRERAAGTTQFVALTPLDAADWPLALRQQIEFLHWDRQTGARTVRSYAG